eukprot:4682-Heterococcus_DN1.PRE.5
MRLSSAAAAKLHQAREKLPMTMQLRSHNPFRTHPVAVIVATLALAGAGIITLVLQFNTPWKKM